MPELDPAQLTAQALDRIRERTPLIHNITNFVVMNDTANVLLALGASPVMAHAIEEVREMVAYAGALVLNIGTLEESWIEAMLVAGEEANVREVPVVLDPVGVGATKLRTATTERIRSDVRVAVVRGNAAELAAIAGLEAKIRGVDAVSSGDPVSAARLAAARFEGVAVVSGAVDYVADGRRLAEIHNGHPLMGRITGSGCMATAITGAFLAVEPDPFLAGVEAMIAFGIAGELAAERSAGPGTFRAHLIDAVAALDGATIRERARASIRETAAA
ncbi:MAG TPA: hydroxyethylthiazole kinase [Candidatus Limnocylindrales bacterium]